MNVLKLQKKYPQFQQNEIFSLQDAFRKLDIEDKGYIDEATVIKATQQSERQPYDVVRQALKEVELDSSRRVELDDYVDLISKVRGAVPGQRPSMTTGRSRGLSNAAANSGAPSPGHQSKSSVSGRIQVQGSSANVTHTINEDERTEFTRHINAVLAGDPDIGHLLPFPTDTFEMFDECKDGLVLAKLINDSVPDTIDERVLNRPGKKIKSLNQFHMTENNNIVINSAKGIGCSVVNIGSGDIIEVREHLILGLIWQIIRRGLLGKIDIKLHPELYRLLEEDETLEQFLRLPPEQILLRWFNYHLKNAKWDKRVSNFSTDVKEGDNYTVLLNQLAPDLCSRGPLQTRDLLQRAEQVLQNADKLQCRKFLSPTSLVAGNPKLNLAFVANLFNTHPGLDPITEEEKLQVEDFDAEGEREARVFTLWLNSLDVQPGVTSFFDDLRDGTILLQAYDKVLPGSVNWRYVNKPPPSGGELMRFKAVENTNYAIELGKQSRFSLVGVQGADITDGQRTLTLGLVWQLMRRDISETLSALAQRLGKREITDAEMVKWANDQSRKGGKNSSIRSFKDQAIGSGVFLLDVLNGMKSSYVDYELVTTGRNDEEAYANAKLAISIARKMGATIWLVPEDISQVRSRLVVTFIDRQAQLVISIPASTTKGVYPLELITRIPSPYPYPFENKIMSTLSSPLLPFPTIDLSPLSDRCYSSCSSDGEWKFLAHSLAAALSREGFAYLLHAPLRIAHDDLIQLARDFFALSREEKMAAGKQRRRRQQKEGGAGYFPAQRGADSFKEGFDVGPPEGVSSSPRQSAGGTPSGGEEMDLTEANIWPPSSQGSSTLRRGIEEAYKELQTLSTQLLSLLAVSLGKEPGFFAHYLEDSVSTLRLLHYPAVTGERRQELSCTEHTDSGLLTLLHQDGTGGLEVLNPEGEWVAAPYVPGSIVLNIGDLMGKVSGGRFKATMHRVRTEAGQERYSVPFFFEPGVECVVRGVDDEGEAEGEGVVYGEHVLGKMKAWVEFQDAEKMGAVERMGTVEVEAV
ncbi:MAG: hypothetical protein Q9214_000230 [Letrouitia sp. 1 TL-2023]